MSFLCTERGFQLILWCCATKHSELIHCRVVVGFKIWNCVHSMERKSFRKFYRGVGGWRFRYCGSSDEISSIVIRPLSVGGGGGGGRSDVIYVLRWYEVGEENEVTTWFTPFSLFSLAATISKILECSLIPQKPWK